MGGTRERRETQEQCLRTQMDMGWLRQVEGLASARCGKLILIGQRQSQGHRCRLGWGRSDVEMKAVQMA